MGTGECAGEIVSLTQFDLANAERLVFEAQLKLDEESYESADQLAYRSMLTAAQALIKTEFLDISTDPETIVREFKKRFHETKIFHDKYAKGKFARYLFNRHESTTQEHTSEQVHRLIEESQLFIEAAHTCNDKITNLQATRIPSSTSLETAT